MHDDNEPIIRSQLDVEVEHSEEDSKYHDEFDSLIHGLDLLRR